MLDYLPAIAEHFPEQMRGSVNGRDLIEQLQGRSAEGWLLGAAVVAGNAENQDLSDFKELEFWYLTAYFAPHNFLFECGFRFNSAITYSRLEALECIENARDRAFIATIIYLNEFKDSKTSRPESNHYSESTLVAGQHVADGCRDLARD